MVAYSEGNAIIAGGLEVGENVLTTRLSRITGRPVQIIEDNNVGQQASKASNTPISNGSVSNISVRSPEFIAKVKNANNLTDDAWRSKTREERRALIQAFRKNGGQ